MSDEAAFLRAIQANPQDDAPRLVYADWLDERGDDHSVRKATFLRMTARLLTARSDLGRNYWEGKLRAAAPALEGEWLAAVSRLPIEACALVFEFRCPRRWENLRATDHPKVRACDACGKSVHFSETIAEARDHARRGRCVALTLGVSRVPGDLFLPVDSTVPGRRFTPEEIRALGHGRQLCVVGRLSTEETHVIQTSLPDAESEPEPQPDEPPRRRLRRERRRKRWTLDAD
jgi:uncharacterized protein (TIGR02996 family)